MIKKKRLEKIIKKIKKNKEKKTESKVYLPCINAMA